MTNGRPRQPSIHPRQCTPHLEENPILTQPVPLRTTLIPTPSPDAWWADGARRAVYQLAAADRIFSADDIFDEPYGVPAPGHPSQVGGLFAGLRSAGLIRVVGYKASTRFSRHSGVQRLWRRTEKLRTQLETEVAA